MMSKYTKYMQDRSAENTLTEEARNDLIAKAKFGFAISHMEGDYQPEDEEEYILYCILNNVSSETMLDNIFKERGFPPIDHEKAKQSRQDYEKYKHSRGG